MKILTALTIAAIALNVSGALAETCEGGSLQTGENGYVYCLSNKTMNWWSAYTWCQAQGKEMASAYDLCPNWDGNFHTGRCQKITNSTEIWTSNAYENEKAVFAYNGGKDMAFDNRNNGGYHYAACIIK